MYRVADVRRGMGFVCPFVLALALFTVNCVGERCSIDDESSCERGENAADKYSRDSNFKLDEYSLAMEEAERNYVECRDTGCDCFQEVITRDTRPFEKKGIGQELIDMTKSRGTFYQIIKNNLYRQKECTFPSRCAGIEHFILKVIEKLPDMDLIINTRDYPQSSKYFGEPLPVFSFSKTPDYFDITYPAWGFWEGGPAISLYPRGLGRWDRHRISLDRAAKTYPWDRKTGKAFFRGSRTSSERDNLILLSRNKSDLVDARYTRNQAWKSDEDTLHAPPAPEVPLEEHCAYKYLFNYRGVAASFRHKHLFLCGSLVFHVGDEWTEFYYDAMKPWIHYVPVPKNAREETLEKLIRFAKDNDDAMRRIASRGRDFVWRKLRMADITCFWESLLRRYGKLLTYEPTLVDDLIRIEKE